MASLHSVASRGDRLYEFRTVRLHQKPTRCGSRHSRRAALPRLGRRQHATTSMIRRARCPARRRTRSRYPGPRGTVEESALRAANREGGDGDRCNTPRAGEIGEPERSGSSVRRSSRCRRPCENDGRRRSRTDRRTEPNTSADGDSVSLSHPTVSATSQLHRLVAAARCCRTRALRPIYKRGPRLETATDP